MFGPRGTLVQEIDQYVDWFCDSGLIFQLGDTASLIFWYIATPERDE
jgi:hypothetical protein